VAHRLKVRKGGDYGHEEPTRERSPSRPNSATPTILRASGSRWQRLLRRIIAATLDRPSETILVLVGVGRCGTAPSLFVRHLAGENRYGNSDGDRVVEEPEGPDSEADQSFVERRRILDNFA